MKNLPLPITFDDLFIYPLSNSYIEKSSNDTVGEKIPYTEKQELDYTCKESLKSLFSGQYIKIDNGKLILKFYFPEEGNYYINLFAFSDNNDNNNFCKIFINKSKDYFGINNKNRNILQWKEYQVSYYNSINNVFESFKPFKLKKGTNEIIINSFNNEEKKYNYFDSIIISKKPYFDKLNKIYFPNKNGIYLAPKNINEINLNIRTFKDNNMIILNNKKYELKINKNCYYESLDTLKYDLYLNGSIIKNNLETHVTPSLIGIIQEYDGTYLNKKFKVKLFMVCEKIATHIKISGTPKVISQFNEQKIIDLGIEEEIILNNNWKKYFYTMNDLFLNEKIKIGLKLDLI